MRENRPHLVLVVPLRKRGGVPPAVLKELFDEIREAMPHQFGKVKLRLVKPERE